MGIKSKSNPNKNKKFKKSFLAACIMAAATQSLAQESNKGDDGIVEEVVVTGMRQTLSSAQDIKREADTVVESITAKDLGSFPDKSVAEALQRVPGVTVNRFAGPSDTAHFSAEPSGVIVRGLQQVRSEFNGRDSFSANSGRGLSWSDISPELMSGVDTYKNQTADLIEGGIAGTINMRTRVPFDQDGVMAALTVQSNYGDLSEEYTPEVSGLYSNRWETAAGEFGFLGNLAYSNVVTRTEGVQLTRMNRFRDVYSEGLNFIPDSVNFRDNIYDRTRNGIALALQWQDSDQKYIATAQFNRSKYDNQWEEYVIGSNMADASFGQSVFYEIEEGSDKIVTPAPNTTDFTWDENGVFQTGTLTRPIGWWGADNEASKGYAVNSSGQQLVNACYGWNGCEPAIRGIDFTSTSRANKNTNLTQDFGLNLKWNPGDTFHGEFDMQYVESQVTNYDISTEFNSWANPEIDLTGSLPKVVLQSPTNVNLSPGGLANPNNYYIKDIMDHVEDSSGHEFAFKSDFKWDIENGWFDSIKVGYRFAERSQDVNWSGYNWQNVVNTWSGNSSAYFNLDRHTPDATSGFNGYPEGFYRAREWDLDYGSISAGDGMGGNTFVVANMDLLKDRKAWSEAMSASSLGIGAWNPVCSNLGGRAGEVPGTCFLPSEMVDLVETTNAFYLKLNFGGDDLQLLGRPISGNIGVRYIQTEDVSTGGESLPTSPADLTCEDIPTTDPNNIPPVPKTVGCYISADDVAYMNGASNVSSTTATHHNVLPSLNIKYEITDEWLVRFAISRAMSRPDIGSLRNYAGVSALLPSVQDASDPLWIKDSAGEIVGANVYYSADAQNPYLSPITADQIDLSLEYYFDRVGSFTVAAFAKKFNDYIQLGKYYRDFTNNEVTRTVEVDGPLNGDGARLRGLELSFQRFFDFMPQPFDGLGMQMNYTYVENDGIPNSNLNSTQAAGSVIDDKAPDTIQINTLEGLSEHSSNLVLMYEKNDWAARLAYSWRSEFLVTAVDCCVAMPVWSEASGQLDGSLKYNLNDNLEVNFQASNILGEETVLTQQVSNSDDGGTRLPNAYFQNDRRFTVGLRLKY
jgi:TonB-dependent receptor